ncbi:Hypothetical protein PHPALM_1609 [Phytophthora palmivora]|uniref:Uncharacterized protein n=1 Tax=Phytophthora palmivora TaxID=4796 RepID=A0A2P4YRX1_9STRA|nr:Hypothetical protein PHPALM_1609 [Phytophthora palmivora]
MKKRGFGMGKYGGLGIPMPPCSGGYLTQSAAPVSLSTDVIVKAEDLQSRGTLLFSFEEGKESDEMKPQWYDTTDIPFKSMWADDSFWLPHVLNGMSVHGHFHFAADEDTLLDHELQVSPAAD